MRTIKIIHQIAPKLAPAILPLATVADWLGCVEITLQMPGKAPLTFPVSARHYWDN